MNIDDNFLVKLIETASPLTKRPSTPFRQVALGILEEEGCYYRESTPSYPLSSSGATLPVIASVETFECELQVDSEYIDGEVGKTYRVQVDHGSNGDYFEGYDFGGVSKFRSEIASVTRVGTEIKVRLVSEGVEEITVNVLYSNCLECSFVISINATEPPPTDEGEEPNIDCQVELNLVPLEVGDIAIVNTGGSSKVKETKFTSSDENVAIFTMEGGEIVVNAIGVGTAELTAIVHFEDGQVCQATATQVVTWDTPPVTQQKSAYFSGGMLSIEDGEVTYLRGDGGYFVTTTLGIGDYPEVDTLMNETLSKSLDSIVISEGLTLELFSGNDFTGDKVVLKGRALYINPDFTKYYENLGASGIDRVELPGIREIFPERENPAYTKGSGLNMYIYSGSLRIYSTEGGNGQ